MRAALKSIFIIFGVCSFFKAYVQPAPIAGLLIDGSTHESISGVSISLFSSGKMLGGISNKEGKFTLQNPNKLDSIAFSMIGYRKVVYKPGQWAHNDFLIIPLFQEPSTMEAVTVRPIGVMDIVSKAAARLSAATPSADYENKAFYRETIKDEKQCYSIAEAIFTGQFSVQKKSFTLGLDKGRSKEDVAYTRMFEDFHPGGGPEDAMGQSLISGKPDFLKESKIKDFIYKKDSTIQFDERQVYILSFDQKPGIKEALEKGKIWVDAADFAVLKFEAENSPVGTPYIKSLKGSDKVFAEILHIDFTMSAWHRTATYIEIADKLFLAYAKMEYAIHYQQPKKDLDLNLTIDCELMVTDFQHPIVSPILKAEEWKRKNLVANLPTDFDASFWGTNNILSATEEISQEILSISKRNQEEDFAQAPEGWEYLNKNFFIATKNRDSLTLIALAKCSWEDNETGGMIFKTIQGDFSIESKLSITKRSNSAQMPDNGFQQCGIIVRAVNGKEENHVIFSMGTGGNDKPKLFLRRTISGKTKGLTDKTENLTAWLRIEKKGHLIHFFRKLQPGENWQKVEDYELDWLTGEIELGFSIMARFAGDGPRQRPDIKAIFSGIQISNQ